MALTFRYHLTDFLKPLAFTLFLTPNLLVLLRSRFQNSSQLFQVHSLLQPGAFIRALAFS